MGPNATMAPPALHSRAALSRSRAGKIAAKAISKGARHVGAAFEVDAGDGVATSTQGFPIKSGGLAVRADRTRHQRGSHVVFPFQWSVQMGRVLRRGARSPGAREPRFGPAEDAGKTRHAARGARSGSGSGSGTRSAGTEPAGTRWRACGSRRSRPGATAQARARPTRLVEVLRQ